MLRIGRISQPCARLRPALYTAQARAAMVHYSSNVEKLKTETDKNGNEESAEMTGVMEYSQSKDVLLFFDKVYPRWLTKLAHSSFWFGWVRSLSVWASDEAAKEDLRAITNSEKHPLPEGSHCTEFVPLRRDGGAFVKFVVPDNSSVKELVGQIEKNIESNKEELASTLLGRLRSFPTAQQVRGTPWIEDLSRFPSRKLKVIFEGQTLTEEELYLLFRRYGRIIDITPANKDVSYAVVLFNNTQSCIRAKNCITGMMLNGSKTTLHLQYIAMERVNYITSFISNHQRIAIPMILALLATIAVLVFEPIRRFFIQLKITHYYSWDAHKDKMFMRLIYVPYSWIASGLSDSRHFMEDSLGSITGSKKTEVEVDELNNNMYWSERSEKANQLRLWVCENANTFIVVKAPKGSGEREFVIDHALSVENAFNSKVLEIDCASLVKSSSDNQLLKTAAHQIGYFPLFTWTNSVSQFLDLGLQGLTGQKSGLSESKETQYKNMLQLASVAIRQVALKDYEAYKCGLERQRKAKLNDSKSEGEAAPSIPKEEDYLQQNPAVKPVIVINNFLRKSDSPHDFVYKALSDWASSLIQNNTAHVIFITQDSGSAVHLTESLPNQVFKTISLDDASMGSAKQYVSQQLRDEKNIGDIESCLAPIGGRMLDLQAFVRRVKSGEKPKVALHEMIQQAAEQISTFFLNISADGQNKEIVWTSAQLWALIRGLANKDSISINDLVESPLFNIGYETVAVLNVLEKHDLISLQREQGIIKSISTGRPLFKAAFKDLVQDVKVFKLYETYHYAQLMSIENAKIVKLEDQVSKLSHLAETKFLKERTEYLCDKINASTEKVRGYEKKIKDISELGKVKKSSSFLGLSLS